MNDPIYLIVGFGLTWAALLWYTLRVERRTRNASRVWKKEEAGGSGTAGAPPGTSGAPGAH